MSKTIFRSKLTKDFTMLPNAMLRDERVSFRARGMLAMILTNACDWEVNKGWIESKTPNEGREAVNSAVKELRARGYATFHHEQGEADGIRNVWTFYDTPGHKDPVRRENRTTGNPLNGKSRTTASPCDGDSRTTGKPSTSEESRKEEESKGQKNGANAPDAVTKKIKKIYSENAVAIYEAYPLKVGRPKALDSIVKAIGKGVKPEELLAKTKAFAMLRKGDMAFCPHPTTWFNEERYNDDPSTWVRSPDKRGVAVTAQDHEKGF